MSNFISKADYKPQIRADVLNQVLEAADEDEDAILDMAELEAMALVTNYLGNRYEMDTEYAKSGDQRHKVLLRMCKVIVIYLIYERVPDDMVPERVVNNYNDVMKMLDDAKEGEDDIPGLTVKTKVDSEGEIKPKTNRRWGSIPARTNDGGSPRDLKH